MEGRLGVIFGLTCLSFHETIRRSTEGNDQERNRAATQMDHKSIWAPKQTVRIAAVGRWFRGAS